jgi:hypothetical protein
MYEEVAEAEKYLKAYIMGAGMDTTAHQWLVLMKQLEAKGIMTAQDIMKLNREGVVDRDRVPECPHRVHVDIQTTGRRLAGYLESPRISQAGVNARQGGGWPLGTRVRRAKDSGCGRR